MYLSWLRGNYCRRKRLHYKNGKVLENPEPIIGAQQLTGTGRNIDCMVEAINRNGLQASVAAEMGRGSIDVLQSGTSFENGVDAWQKINSASGENIELDAKTSDKLGLNISSADSSVKVDHGFLQNYRSETEATLKSTMGSLICTQYMVPLI